MSHEQRSEAAVANRQLHSARGRPSSGRPRVLRAVPESGKAAPAFGLPTVQRWLQAVIVHPGDVEEAIASPEAATEVAPERLEELVKPSHSLTSTERVEIYHDMYLLRMVEALEADYPAVRHFLGEAEFEQMVVDYVGSFPSRSYTLNRLGDHLPRFFAEHPERPHAAFLADLARYELAVTQAFDEAQSPVLAPDDVAAIPATAWVTARLVPVAAFRLLALRHPVAAHVEAARNGWTPPRPRRRQSWLAVYRRDYSVLRVELSRPQYELLAALGAGEPLGEAVAAAALRLPAARREGTVHRWFSSWVAAQMFSRVVTETDRA
jgi:Putative DNA-binding domain